MTYETFTDELLRAIPEYIPDDRDLPHVALGGLVSFLVTERSRAPGRLPALMARVVKFIETEADSGDVHVNDLIKMSFMENLHLLGADCAELVTRLGPKGPPIVGGLRNAMGVCLPIASCDVSYSNAGGN